MMKMTSQAAVESAPWPHADVMAAHVDGDMPGMRRW